MIGRAYLFVGGPMHGQMVAVPGDSRTYVMARPTPALYRDPETEEVMHHYEEIVYVRDTLASVDEDGTRWVMHVMVESGVMKLGPFAKTRMAFGAAIRRLPGVEMQHDPMRR